MLLALLPDLTMAKWRKGGLISDQGFVRREMRNFFGFERRIPFSNNAAKRFLEEGFDFLRNNRIHFKF